MSNLVPWHQTKILQFCNKEDSSGALAQVFRVTFCSLGTNVPTVFICRSDCEYLHHLPMIPQLGNYPAMLAD